MPAQHGLRPDDEERAGPGAQPARQEDQQAAIQWGERGPLGRSVENQHLLPQERAATADDIRRQACGEREGARLRPPAGPGAERVDAALDALAKLGKAPSEHVLLLGRTTTRWPEGTACGSVRHRILPSTAPAPSVASCLCSCG